MRKYQTNLNLTSARDRNDIGPLRQQPRQRDLSGRGVVLGGDCVERVNDVQQAREVLLREAGYVASEVAFLKVIRGFLQWGISACSVCDAGTQ